MTIHEFGKENDKTIVLVHPSVVMWDYFEYVIPFLQKKYHLVIPAIPGYDPDVKSDFTSIEEIAEELEDWLIAHGRRDVTCLYGCSMGGSIVVRMLANNRLHIGNAIMDGGITPYPLPWIITRLIAIKDFLMIYIGKIGGVKLLEKAFAMDALSREDVEYAAGVLKMISAKTIWNTFVSCNNYSMPGDIHTDCEYMEYWIAEKERKERKWDVNYIRNIFPQTTFKEIKETGHGGLAPFYPERFVKGIEKTIARDKESF